MSHRDRYQQITNRHNAVVSRRHDYFSHHQLSYQLELEACAPCCDICCLCSSSMMLLSLSFMVCRILALAHSLFPVQSSSSHPLKQSLREIPSLQFFRPSEQNYFRVLCHPKHFGFRAISKKTLQLKCSR